MLLVCFIAMLIVRVLTEIQFSLSRFFINYPYTHRQRFMLSQYKPQSANQMYRD